MCHTAITGRLNLRLSASPVHEWIDHGQGMGAGQAEAAGLERADLDCVGMPRQAPQDPKRKDIHILLLFTEQCRSTVYRLARF
jgi:hypothetical protein